MKKSIMAALLAGVMTVSVVSTACGKEEKKETQKSIKDITHSIAGTLEDAKKAMKGELDFAYNASASVSFGSALKDMIGTEVKSVEISTNTKQKGKRSAVDMSVNYDSNSVASINLVTDHANGTSFLKVPEISDAYIKATSDDIKGLLESQTENLIPNEGMADSDVQVNEKMLKALCDIDFYKLSDNMNSYIDLIKEKTPEAKKGEKISGEIDGNKYTYDTKTYEIKAEDWKAIAKAVVDKAKEDKFLKDLATSMGCTDEDYSSKFDSALESFNEAVDESEVSKIDTYYNDDDVCFGWNIHEENLDFKYIVIDEEDKLAVDCVLKTDDMDYTISGSADRKDGKINGELNGTIKTEDQSMDVKVTMIDVEDREDVFAGTVKVSYKMDQYGVVVEPNFEIKSGSTKDKLDVTMKVCMGKDEYFTFAMKCEKTDASDIELPTGKTYSMTDESDMEKYISSCDIEKFTGNVNTILGEELYNNLFGAQEYDDSILYDEYDYDLEDYDLPYGEDTAA